MGWSSFESHARFADASLLGVVGRSSLDSHAAFAAASSEGVTKPTGLETGSVGTTLPTPHEGSVRPPAPGETHDGSSSFESQAALAASSSFTWVMVAAAAASETVEATWPQVGTSSLESHARFASSSLVRCCKKGGGSNRHAGLVRVV